MRPFEIGDFVTGYTIYRPAIKTTAIVKNVTNFEHGGQNVFVDCNGIYLSCEEFIIDHIRTHRPGSDDARNICAMLTRELRTELKNELLDFRCFKIENEYWKSRKSGKLCKAHRNRLKTAKRLI